MIGVDAPYPEDVGSPRRTSWRVAEREGGRQQSDGHETSKDQDVGFHSAHELAQ